MWRPKLSGLCEVKKEGSNMHMMKLAIVLATLMIGIVADAAPAAAFRDARVLSVTTFVTRFALPA